MRRRSKILLGLVVVGLVAIVAVRHWQADIGERLFARGVEARVGRDVTLGLADGLHIGLCGTGSPLPNADRAGPCTVVIAGKRVFVVDSGEGGARNISMMGIPNGKIERLFLTHFHSDHMDGLGPMMLLRWTGSAHKAPLPIHGPEGVTAVVDGFNGAYTADFGYRVAHHGEKLVPSSGAGGAAVSFPIPAGPTVIFDDGGLRVTAFPVDHKPVMTAVGYRFDYKGRSVVISGDTAKSSMVEQVSKGADLLVHEALQPRLVKLMTAGLEKKGVKNTAQITRDILDYHASPEEAAQSAKAAAVKMLLLTHIVPPLPNRFFYPAFLGDAARQYPGEIVVGEDGMFLSLPAAKPTIERRKLL